MFSGRTSPTERLPVKTLVGFIRPFNLIQTGETLKGHQWHAILSLFTIATLHAIGKKADIYMGTCFAGIAFHDAWISKCLQLLKMLQILYIHWKSFTVTSCSSKLHGMIRYHSLVYCIAKNIPAWIVVDLPPWQSTVTGCTAAHATVWSPPVTRRRKNILTTQVNRQATVTSATCKKGSSKHTIAVCQRQASAAAAA